MNGVLVLPLRRFDDPRGWFMELRRESLLPDRTLQTNLSFSRAAPSAGCTTTPGARTTCSSASRG